MGTLLERRLNAYSGAVHDIRMLADEFGWDRDKLTVEQVNALAAYSRAATAEADGFARDALFAELNEALGNIASHLADLVIVHDHMLDDMRATDLGAAIGGIANAHAELHQVVKEGLLDLAVALKPEPYKQAAE